MKAAKPGWPVVVTVALALLVQSLLAAIHAPGRHAFAGASQSEFEIRLVICSTKPDAELPTEFADFPFAPPTPDQAQHACPICAVLFGISPALPARDAPAGVHRSTVAKLSGCSDATERKLPLVHTPRSRGPPVAI
jgi:hypothetical protein